MTFEVPTSFPEYPLARMPKACACDDNTPCLLHFGQLSRKERIEWKNRLGISGRS